MLKDNIIYPSIDKIGNYYLKQNYIDVINKEKIKEEKLQEIADIAFESEYLKNEKRDKILEGGKTLEQTIKDSYKNALLAEQNSTNPKFHRTSHQKELSFKFKEEHKIKIEEMENKIYDLDELIVEIKKSSKSKNKYSKETTMHICEEEIKAYNELKDFCYKHGEGGMIYFQDFMGILSL